VGKPFDDPAMGSLAGRVRRPDDRDEAADDDPHFALMEIAQVEEETAEIRFMVRHNYRRIARPVCRGR
jgi:hypothetical protein